MQQDSVMFNIALVVSLNCNVCQKVHRWVMEDSVVTVNDLTMIIFYDIWILCISEVRLEVEPEKVVRSVTAQTANPNS